VPKLENRNSKIAPSLDLCFSNFEVRLVRIINENASPDKICNVESHVIPALRPACANASEGRPEAFGLPAVWLQEAGRQAAEAGI
jgi:hypothetical protein